MKKLLSSAITLGAAFWVSSAFAVTPVNANVPVKPAEKLAAQEEIAPDYLAESGTGDDYLAARPAGVYDPLEGVNRGIFTFNKAVDRVVLRPVSETYKFIVPEFGRHRVTNFIENLSEPVVFANSLLQANPQNMFVSFWRFTFNSTLGVLGMFDMATELGVPAQHKEDFGQTLATWGMGGGAYLVLPLLGPSNLRDVVGIPVDMLMNPFTYALQSHERITIGIVDGVDTRARYGKLIDDTYSAALDPYATFRSLYLQRRGAMIINSGVNEKQLRSLSTVN
jgi:phospholipid-binding lipoprotein MlaA